MEGLFWEIKSHLSNDRIATPARNKCALESHRTFHLSTRATPITPVSWALNYSPSIHASKLSSRLDCMHLYASSIIYFKRTPRNYKPSSSGHVKIMFPVPAPRGASDVPPYTPTDLISPTVVSAPPYTEIATQDPADSNETATGDPAVANLTPKARHRRRETCPLSSHPWVLWLLWLYCSALFSVEIVELIRLLPLFYIQCDFVFGERHCA